MANLIRNLFTYDPQREFQDRKWKLSCRMFYLLFLMTTVMIFTDRMVADQWITFWTWGVPAIAGIYTCGNILEYMTKEKNS